MDDLRNDYNELTGKAAAIRWNRKTLEKKIRDAKLIKEADERDRKRLASEWEDHCTPNPEFERLLDASDESIESEEGVEPDQRGGSGRGQGRKTGQTDERARIERVMSLEVPDLGVSMLVGGISAGMAKVTGEGLDDVPSQLPILENMPHGSQSMSLGLTRLLYYWFPSLQGRTDALTLHLEALALILNPLRERAIRLSQKIKETKNVEKEKSEETAVGNTSAIVPDQEPQASVAVKPKRRKANRVSTRSKRYRRSVR
jgi:hypothetical protein